MCTLLTKKPGPTINDLFFFISEIKFNWKSLSLSLNFHIRDQYFHIQTDIFAYNLVCSDFILEFVRLVQCFISELNSLFYENMECWCTTSLRMYTEN